MKPNSVYSIQLMHWGTLRLKLTGDKESHSGSMKVKHLRYQADFFSSHYGGSYRQRIKDFKAIQDVLGTLQDAWVFAQMLHKIDGPSWTKHLPSMHKQLQQERWQAWQQWEEIRAQYVTVSMRSHLHQMIMQPWLD